MNKSSEKFLHDYLNNFSPTGHEVEGQKLWMKYLKKTVDEFFTDPYGTAVGVINPGKKYKVVIEAHADEISWLVQYISSEGLIYVTKNGGSDQMIAPAKRVNIYSDKGLVKGVFGWPAIHTRKGTRDEVPKVEKLFIDVGAKDDKEVKEMGIRAGNVVAFEDGFIDLGKNYFCGRALDNRIGGFMIAEVAKMIRSKKVKLPYTLYIVNSVQEEVGLRGAKMIAERLNPDLAIVTDVTHDTSTPGIDKRKEGDVVCGSGPSLIVGPAVHQNVFKRVVETAKKNKIDIQYEAASRSTGTDTDAFAYSGTGVPSALISLPLKYMHTTVEMAHRKDIDACIKLIFHFLKDLKSGTNFSYF